MDDAAVYDPLEPGAMGWLAFAIGLEHEPDDRCPAVDELGDALLVGADAEIARLVPAAVDVLWNAELERLIREGLDRQVSGGGWEGEPEAALADLDQRGAGSAIARAVVEQIAQGVANEGLSPLFCLHCIEEEVGRAKPKDRRAFACKAAQVAARDIEVDDAEIRAARRNPSGAVFARALATDERRALMRRRLAGVARLGTTSVPALATELRSLLAEPAPDDPADDLLWRALCRSLAQRRLEPMLN